MNSLILAFAAASAAFSLPPGLLSAVCKVESNHVVTAFHPQDGSSGSHGVCQMKLGTARSLGFRGTLVQLYGPHVNVFYAAKLLRYHLDHCRSTEDAILAYSSGKCGKGRRTYLRKVLEGAQK